MAFAISRQTMDKMESKARRGWQMAARLREKGEEATNQVLQTLEVNAAAFGWGLANGYAGKGGVSVAGIPADLGSGVLLHAAGLLGLGGNASEHLHNLGDGCLASYFASMGVSVGAGWRAGGGAASRGDEPLSDAELARLGA